MKTAFIITSAIFTRAGIYSPDIRILQTQDTINSIKKFYPDALLILAEGGADQLKTSPPPNWEALRARVNVFLDMTGNEQINHLHTSVMNENPNRTEMGGLNGMAKTIAELTLTANTLEAIKNHPDLAPIRDTDRIFKISGRYVLSPMFDPSVYDQAQGKYVFRRRDPSWIPDAQKAVGTDHFFASRLWSFDTAMLDQTLDKYLQMLEDVHGLADTTYVDIEHLLYKHLGTEQTLEVDHTHLMGTIAPNGMMVYD